MAESSRRRRTYISSEAFRNDDARTSRKAENASTRKHLRAKRTSVSSHTHTRTPPCFPLALFYFRLINYRSARASFQAFSNSALVMNGFDATSARSSNFITARVQRSRDFAERNSHYARHRVIFIVCVIVFTSSLARTRIAFPHFVPKHFEDSAFTE